MAQKAQYNAEKLIAAFLPFVDERNDDLEKSEAAKIAKTAVYMLLDDQLGKSIISELEKFIIW